MTSETIIKEEHGVSRVFNGPDGAFVGTEKGARLTMADGSVWFHPYTGGQPVCEVKAASLWSVWVVFNHEGDIGSLYDRREHEVRAHGVYEARAKAIAAQHEADPTTSHCQVDKCVPAE